MTNWWQGHGQPAATAGIDGNSPDPEPAAMTFDSRPPRDRLEREAEAEHRPGDPGRSRPADARRIMVILSAALAVAIVALGAMFLNNARYDGASPVPVSERARP